MDRSPRNGDSSSTDLVVAIIETLEACGLDRDDYQLYDTVDPEALEQLLDSSTRDLEVRFTVEGIRIAVTSDGIDVLADEQPMC
ncbi:HalOD1 output domain-containing protein [Natronolimnohabitans sp. A-GB9]|uniref:HalOD1 output domain-containing protein n=1 Tax=Natronolimnohabitans sp. A-GB9 TaxID=3069757 RepID=UPI0027B77540|nr:HalOD1 output domain-containing protein [Natronolimnohabitans sp. A-GB9]MDQ2051646.1 HalOD1 output domain-containing protein [Natronolimnohabitans sp. A-GB9]